MTCGKCVRMVIEKPLDLLIVQFDESYLFCKYSIMKYTYTSHLPIYTQKKHNLFTV